MRNEVYKRIGKKFRQGTISSWENGKTAPDMDVLNVLASILEVNVDELYEKQNNSEASYVTSIKDILLYKKALNEIQSEFDSGSEPEAFMNLRELAEEILDNLNDVVNQHEKVITQLKAVREIMRL
ncbi:helix-turn-helix domain-containing protein [Fulvivirga ligni]|nr:helix-turn-helix domain-containing protein [Fulvivirga ligni]